jgi:hypothetical protein
MSLGLLPTETGQILSPILGKSTLSPATFISTIGIEIMSSLSKASSLGSEGTLIGEDDDVFLNKLQHRG